MAAADENDSFPQAVRQSGELVCDLNGTVENVFKQILNISPKAVNIQRKWLTN